jgi:drug/metabolite transporter (DMT)-like permease
MAGLCCPSTVAWQQKGRAGVAHSAGMTHRAAKACDRKLRMHPFKAIGLKLISALLFAAMSALVRKLGDVAPVGQMVFSAAPLRFSR